MNKLYCQIVLLIVCSNCQGQNLVPNGDFEQYIGCPNSYAQFDSCLFWIDPYLYWQYGSPDYYNQCAPDFSQVDVPNMTSGYQLAHSGGAFAGVFLWHQTMEIREHIEIALTTTLTANTCYHFEMYVNLANHVKFTTSEIGVYFSDTLLSGIDSTQNFIFSPQINNSAWNSFDTLNWVLVSGYYTASGGENFLLIGNFKNNANSNTAIVNNTSQFPFVYAYIDDVSLSICTGTDENNTNEIIDVFPNPYSDKIKITVKRNELVEFVMYDVTGSKTIQESFTNSISINTEQLAKGLYLYEVRNKNGVFKKGKVVKR